MMPPSAGICLALLTAATLVAGGAPAPSLIPRPQTLAFQPGEFRLAPDTRIISDASSLPTAKQLAARLRPATGYALSVKTKSNAGAAMANVIVLTSKNANAHLGAEGYELTVTTNSVVIRAPAPAGLFYGAQTLLQLLPPEIFSPKAVKGAAWPAPCVHIRDWPRFKWRGLMLDVSRHFYTKAEVEQVLDLMALYKLNMFHWHLADDDGWRIEIKEYPLLTQIGAWRDRDVLARNTKPDRAQPVWAAPASDKFGPDGRYGGYYTQEDIREVVAYAGERHVTIVPEIEMPGHSGAALAAYGKLSCSGEPYLANSGQPFHVGVFCAGNEDTFTFLRNVLTEVSTLFPGKYMHVGGDEVNKTNWKHCQKCQALMQREGLKNEEELQSWFIQRVEKIVDSRGKTMIGWSEIMQGGLAANAVVMDWIGGGQEAARKGHDVVMSPTAYCYFDHYQSTNHATEPEAIGDYLPLKQVYDLEPIPSGLPAQDQSHILGAQANLWTEYVASLPHAEYMLFPRLCALAEAVWSPQEGRAWDDFQRRLPVEEQRLDQLCVNHRHASYLSESKD